MDTIETLWEELMAINTNFLLQKRPEVPGYWMGLVNERRESRHSCPNPKVIGKIFKLQTCGMNHGSDRFFSKPVKNGCSKSHMDLVRSKTVVITNNQDNEKRDGPYSFIEHCSNSSVSVKWNSEAKVAWQTIRTGKLGLGQCVGTLWRLPNDFSGLLPDCYCWSGKLEPQLKLKEESALVRSKRF